MTTSVFIHEIKNSLNVIYGIAQLFEIGEVTAATDVSEYAKTLKKWQVQRHSANNNHSAQERHTARLNSEVGG
jgi:nitrogen-specific signal transduction histidine kinase